MYGNTITLIKYLVLNPTGLEKKLTGAQEEDVITIMSGHEAARVVANRSGRKTIEKLHLGCGLEQEINTVRSHSHGHHPASSGKTLSWPYSTKCLMEPVLLL